MFKSIINFTGNFIKGLTVQKLKQYRITVLIFLFLALLGYIGILRLELRNTKTQLIIANQNTAAAGDTIRKITTKTGDSETVKISFLVKKVKDLESLNAQLAAKAKVQPGQVHNIASIGVVLNRDSMAFNAPINIALGFNATIPPVEGPCAGSYTIPANYADSSEDGSLQISGTISFTLPGDSARIALDRLRLRLSTLTIGTTTIDGKLTAFAQSKYPGVTFDKLDWASFDPGILIKAPSRFWLGVKCLGVGMMLGAGIAETARYFLIRKK